jgi:hypothetical protein
MARSFDNLVALANHQERLREARRMVWRDKGEPVADLNDLWECAQHAAKGGMSALSNSSSLAGEAEETDEVFCRGREHGV